jgi:hypothetical protein
MNCLPPPFFSRLRSIEVKSLAGIQELDFVVHEFPSLGGFGEPHAEHILDVE